MEEQQIEQQQQQPQPPVMLPQAEEVENGGDEIRFAQKDNNGSQEEQMQHYLYEQILVQGYNGEEFRAFLKGKYPGADQNLSQITMSQLQEVTTAFKLQSVQSNRSSVSSNSQVPANDYNKQEYLSFDEPNLSQISKISSGSRITQSTFVGSGNNAQIDRSRQPSAFLNEKSSDAQQFAINKSILQEPGSNQKQLQAQKSQIPQSLTTSVYIQGQPQLSASQRVSVDQQGIEELNQSILNSTFSSSRVIKDAQGQTIVRKEAQIVPQTSSVKDAFIKKNIEGEESSKVITCRALEKSKIADFYDAQLNESSLKQHQRLKVVIDKYEVVYDGLFSSEYALYNVQTPAMEWCVSRRFNDFYWLYHTLRKHHPGNFIPPIPKKTAIKEMSGEHLYQRMRAFEQFLNEILLNPTLSVSPFVSDFLSMIDQKAFEAKRKEHDLRQTPTIVDMVSTVNGELTIEITPPLKEYWFQFKDQNSKSLLNYTNLNEGFDGLISSLKKAAEESNKIALNFSRMHKVHEQFNKISPLGKYTPLENMNIHLNNYFIEFANTLCNIQVAFEKNMFEYIRYQNLMYEEYKSTINYHDELQNSYLEHLKRLNQKKDKLFTNTNTSKWEIDSSCPVTVRELQNNKIEAIKYMLPGETKQVQNEGEFFGFVNKQLYEDVCHHIASSKDIVCNRFVSLSQDLALEINKLHIHTADHNMRFSEMLGQKNSSLNQRYRPE